MEMVLECFMDDETRTIGVYGMSGVGKTFVMMEIRKRLLEQQQQHFDKVIWVDVSESANARKIQDEIAKALGLTLSNEQDETERSILLLGALEERKRLLLILDEVWQVFTLHDIGIPGFTNESGCKLVLTSRSMEVCEKMGCMKYIQIELLPEDEAWELFLKSVGVKLDAEVEEIAKAIVKVCSGLPLAIITVAGAMRAKDDIQEWRVALTDLKEISNSVRNMEERVSELLKFCYNHLGHDILKNALLDCAMNPKEGRVIPGALVEPWVMEGLINGKSIKYVVNQGEVILDLLKQSGMLEYGFGILDIEHVQMHGLIWDMALQVAKEMNRRIMVKAGVPWEDFPNEEAWEEDLEKASFTESGVKEILISPNCPELTTLLLNVTPSLKHIAHGFFVHMPSLKVVNLSFSRIESLPDSISDLLNLQVLDLSYCGGLKEVPSLEKLQSLIVLKLGYTRIEELPHGMEELVNLVCLHIEGTQIREIPALLISKFSSLQELCMDHLPNYASRELLNEVLSLIYLESLSISFEDLHDYSYYELKSLANKQLDYFSFFVGYGLNETWKSFWKRGRSVSIHADYSNLLHGDANLLLPENIENLEITEFEGLTNFPKLVYIDYNGVLTHGALPYMKKLRIWYCETLEYLTTVWRLNELQNLVELDISDCWELEELIGGSSDDERPTSTSLKKIRLSGLPKLKSMFSRRTSFYFQNLEEVKIEGCRGMEELIASEEGSSYDNTTTILFPQLKKLDLETLPKLKSIWNGEMVCDSLETITVKQCVELKRLPRFMTMEDYLPTDTLQDIRGSRKWWDSLEWDGPVVKSLLQPLFHEQDEDEYEGEVVYEYQSGDYDSD